MAAGVARANGWTIGLIVLGVLLVAASFAAHFGFWAETQSLWIAGEDGMYQEPTPEDYERVALASTMVSMSPELRTAGLAAVITALAVQAAHRYRLRREEAADERT